jgi:peptide/nickel transport system substrate-binding protein
VTDMRRSLRVSALIAVLAIAAAACSGGGGGGGGGTTIQKGGTFRIGTSSTIDSLNPFVGFQANSYLVWYEEYPYLNTYDVNNDIVPYFAKSWDVSSDGLTWTFHLVSGAKWSDGQPLDANDVAWMFNTVVKYKSGPTSYWAAYVVGLDKVTATDADTVQFVYNRPIGPALSQLGAIPVLPEHIWGQYATGDGKALKTFANVPENGKPVVSGGPFMLTEYKKDQIALMQRNDSYWGTEPYLDGFGIQIYDNDDAMVTAFKNGELDGVETVPTTAVKTIQDAGFNIATSPGVFFYDFIINSNPKKPAHRELLNPQVREAFEYAIDREQIIKVALNGYGTPGDSIVPPATGSWHDPNLHPLPFDLTKANQILDSLGYQRGSDGIRVADGQPMAYTVIIPSSRQAELTRTFQILQPDFQQIGVKLTLKVLDPSAAFDAIGAPNYKYLDFDLAMWDWIPGPDPASILSVLLCNQYGTNSDTGYCDPTYDKMYQQQEAEVDPQKRQQIVYQMEEKLFNDRPYIVLNYPDVIDAYDGKHWAGFFNEKGYGIFVTESSTAFNQIHRIG